MPDFLFVRSPDLDRRWPYSTDQALTRLSDLGEVSVINNDVRTPLHEQRDLSNVNGLIYFDGGPELTSASIAAAPRLRMVGAVSDNAGLGMPLEAMFARDIPFIDGTRGWAQSVSEIALALALASLRRIPWWHRRMATETPETVWQYEADQFCDDKRFVNGTLGSKRVGIVGLGQIGRRVASWCSTMGAEVLGYDPFLPSDAAHEFGAELRELDRIAEEVDILFVTVPPTPSARHIVSRDRVDSLKKGAIVVVVTRAHGIDMEALRKRVYADEIMGAFDVYDIEPIPADDPLRDRDNVIHLPHIAGRTRDSNVEAIDIIVDDFARLLRGEAPVAKVTREMVDIRLHRKDVPAE